MSQSESEIMAICLTSIQALDECKKLIAQVDDLLGRR
jgi:hypothetical protein